MRFYALELSGVEDARFDHERTVANISRNLGRYAIGPVDAVEFAGRPIVTLKGNGRQSIETIEAANEILLARLTRPEALDYTKTAWQEMPVIARVKEVLAPKGTSAYDPIAKWALAVPLIAKSVEVEECNSLGIELTPTETVG